MNNEIKKIKYEKPVILDLGEMAEGVGMCISTGSGNSTGACVDGNLTTSGASCQEVGSSNTGSNCANGPDTIFTLNIACNGGPNNTGLDCGSGTTPHEA